MSERVEFISQYTILPTGMKADDDQAYTFALTVTYRGPFTGRRGGGYAVEHGSRSLSRAGAWSLYVEEFRRWQYRWATLDQAIAAAREQVDGIVVNGRTWAQWKTERAG